MQKPERWIEWAVKVLEEEWFSMGCIYGDVFSTDIIILHSKLFEHQE